MMEPLPSAAAITTSTSYAMHQPQSLSINPPKLNSEKMQTYLNEAVNRHSFSESIYSEPYYIGGRYESRNQQRNGSSMAYQNANGTSAGPLHQSTIEISGRIVPLSKSNSSTCQPSYASGSMSNTSKSMQSRRSDGGAAVLVKSSQSYENKSALRPQDRTEFSRTTNSSLDTAASVRSKKQYEEDMRMPSDVSRNDYRKYSEPCVSTSAKVEARGTRANSEQYEQRLLPPKAENVFQYEFPTPTATETNFDAQEATANDDEKSKSNMVICPFSIESKLISLPHPLLF